MRRVWTVAPAAVAFAAAASLALGTPGLGIISASVHARGTNAESLNLHSEAGIKLKTKAGLDFVTQQIVIGPNGTTGWHSHPGPVLVTVKSGSLRLVYADDDDCEGRTYLPGDSFVDRGDEHVHTAIAGSDGVDLWATYLVPGAPGTPFRINADSPGTCPF